MFIFCIWQRIADIFGLSKADNKCENVWEKPKSEAKACPVPKRLCDTEIDTDRKIEHTYSNQQFAYITCNHRNIAGGFKNSEFKEHGNKNPRDVVPCRPCAPALRKQDINVIKRNKCFPPLFSHLGKHTPPCNRNQKPKRN